jgi:hypothetical protein
MAHPRDRRRAGWLTNRFPMPLECQWVFDDEVSVAGTPDGLTSPEHPFVPSRVADALELDADDGPRGRRGPLRVRGDAMTGARPEAEAGPAS